jgi:hypothetical protein
MQPGEFGLQVRLPTTFRLAPCGNLKSSARHSLKKRVVL